MNNRPNITEFIIATGFLSLFTAGAFGAFGAIVHYLFVTVQQNERYSFTSMFIYSVMGFFVGMVVASLMLETVNQVYPGIVLISGFLFLKILSFIDERGMNIIIDRLKKKP